MSARTQATYTGSAVNIEDSTLTISGGGKFTNSQDLVFNDAASVLNLNGIAEISKVKFPASLATGKLIAAEDVSIQSLTHTGDSIIDISSGKTLTVKDNFGVDSNKFMVMSGSGGILKLDDTLTLSGTLKIDGQSTLESGTLSFDGGILSVNDNSTVSSAVAHVESSSSTIKIASGKRLKLESNITVPEASKMNLTGSDGELELGNTLTVAGTLEFTVPHTLDSGTVDLNGGTLNVKQDVSVSSAITHSVDSKVDVSTGSTLTLTGGDIDVGAKTLTLSGGGSVANQGQLILDDPISILKLGGIASVKNVSMPATFSTGKLEVSENAIVQNLLNSGLSRVDILDTKTLSIENGFEIPQEKSMELIGDGGTLSLDNNMELSGTLKFSSQGTLNSGTVSLNGGLLDVDQNITIGSDLLHTAGSSIEIEAGKALSYTGQGLNIGNLALDISGGGTFDNTNYLTLNNSQSKLMLGGASISKVEINTVLTDGEVSVSADSTIDTLSHTGTSRINLNEDTSLTFTNPFDIPENQTMELLGSGTGRTVNLPDGLTLTGTLKISSENYTFSSGTLKLNGGLLDVLETTNINSDISHLASSNISIKSEKTLNYGGDALDIGALTMTLSGGGTIENTNALSLDNTASVLVLNGINQIASVSVEAALTSGKLSVENDAVIKTLSHTGSSILDISNDTSLTVKNSFEVPQNKSLELAGAENGTLILEDKLTLSGIININVSDKFSGGTLELNGGTLSVNVNSTIESAITNIDQSSINVSSGKTLTYTGSEAQIGTKKLTLSGGGLIENTNDFALNEPSSILVLDEIEVSKVSITGDLIGGQLTVNNDSVIKTLTNTKSSRLEIGNGNLLTVENSFEVPENIKLEFVGSGNGTMQINDTLTLSGTVKFDAPDYTLNNGTLALNGGTLESSYNTTVASDIKHLSDSTVIVAADKTLNYSGDVLEIGARTLTISGGGDFSNTNNLDLNHENSVLKLDGKAKVEHVSVGEDLSDGFIDVDDNATIKTLFHTKSSKFDVATEKTLTLENAIEIAENQTLELFGSGGGTLKISDTITLAGILKLNAAENTISGGKLIFNDGTLDLDKDASIATKIILNNNASMDLSSGKTLSVTQSFEVPENLKLEILGTDGGSLSLSETETLEINGILLFSSPTVNSGIPYHSLIDGTLELVDGALLDVDYDTSISSNIIISGNSSIDVASGKTLTYTGEAIDIKTFQLTLLGTGKLDNDDNPESAVTLNNSNGIIVFADDITVALVKVTAGSSSGKGIHVNSADAKVTNLNLLADLVLKFAEADYDFDVENLTVISSAKLTAEGSIGLLKVNELLQDDVNAMLTLHNVNVKVKKEIILEFANQIAITGSTIFEVDGGLKIYLTGTMDFKGSVTAKIDLMGGTMCVTDNTTINGNIRNLDNSLIYIAPEKVLTYNGTNTLDVNGFELDLQGGGYFSSLNNNSISLNQDGGTLKLADNATKLSHLHFDQSVSSAVLEVSQNQSSACAGDDLTDDSSTILVENLDHAGSTNLKLAGNTLLSLPSSISVPQQKSMTVSGENGELTFGGTVTFENKSEFILNSSGSKISGSFDFTNNNIMNAQETVNFDSKVSKWNNSQIKVTEGATLQFTDNQWQTQGTLTKTGGSMSLEKVVWSLSADTSYSSDTAVKMQTLSLNNHLLTLGTEGSDITVTDNMTFDNSSEHISTGLADLNLEGSLILKEGEITSTGGIVFLGTGGKQSGGKLDVTDSTLKLGDDFTKTEGTLTVNENGTTLELTNNVTLTSNTALSLKELSLNDNTLSLGSDTTDLTVRDPIILNHTNEKILANAADLSLTGLLSMDNGEINSDNASLKFNGGINQTGGQLNLINAKLELVDDIIKTGGSLLTTGTEVTISADMKITSNSELSVKSIL